MHGVGSHPPLSIGVVMKRIAFALATLLSLGAAQAEDTLKKVKESGTITMGVRESSGVLSYTLGGAKYVGYHVAICERAIENIEKAVGRKLTVKYQPVTSQNRIPLVQNGTVDIECGSTTNNATRQKDVAFANTTFVEEVRMAVKADSPIKSVLDLKDKNVATTTGTTSVLTLRKNKRASNLEFKEVLGKDHADSFLLLESGRADAFVMDGSLLAGLIARSKNPKDFKIVGEVLSVEPIAIMMRKDDEGLTKIVNATIADLVKSGEIYKLYDKWFLQPTVPSGAIVNLPMSNYLKEVLTKPNNLPAEEYAKKVS
jgi:glutamate/aspartate transport system substrate-binding protein